MSLWLDDDELTALTGYRQRVRKTRFPIPFCQASLFTAEFQRLSNAETSSHRGRQSESITLSSSNNGDGDMDLMTLDELRALPTITSDDTVGVYFLWRMDELQYIGHSRNLTQRLWIHKTTMLGLTAGKVIPFNQATRITCAKDGVLPIERAYIKHYRPPFNKQGTK